MQMEHGEPYRCWIAAHHHRLAAEHETRDLQLEIKLVRAG
jgi:hypothetical protein